MYGKKAASKGSLISHFSYNFILISRLFVHRIDSRFCLLFLSSPNHQPQSLAAHEQWYLHKLYSGHRRFHQQFCCLALFHPHFLLTVAFPKIANLSIQGGVVIEIIDEALKSNEAE
jgi:hypothetical protein